jgi:hypothetical protein
MTTTHGRNITVGTELADGTTVVRVSVTDSFAYVRSVDAEGKTYEHRYRPYSVVPTAEYPNPPKFAKGHPWRQYRRFANPKKG